MCPEARGAIISGDREWFKEHVGEIAQDHPAPISKIGEREVW
ncbi:MAG: hypothetical protein ABSE08_04095 [Syntrophobacteraceae bacterium]|jgi:hypothetical protein